jgi:hypothetical protein
MAQFFTTSCHLRSLSWPLKLASALLLSDDMTNFISRCWDAFADRCAENGSASFTVWWRITIAARGPAAVNFVPEDPVVA